MSIVQLVGIVPLACDHQRGSESWCSLRKCSKRWPRHWLPATYVEVVQERSLPSGTAATRTNWFSKCPTIVVLFSPLRHRDHGPPIRTCNQNRMVAQVVQIQVDLHRP